MDARPARIPIRPHKAMHGTALSAKHARKHAGHWLCALAIACSLLSPGCRTCPLPRIDPTGQSVFAPGTTTLDPQFGQLPTPQPAFVAPPAPPPCGPGQTGHCKKQHIKLHCDKLCAGIQREMGCVGDEGQLIVTPASVIAPVGSEVVLLAGLCGPERTFIARQPIEFVMSQESVGNFVQVGEDGECAVTRLYRSQPKKATGGYAVGVSSASDQVITRGTPQPNDDIRLGRGQTWLSVTSPSEGTSYVTVLAPKAKNWDQRRQTAMIHWVDAQWVLPSPAIVPARRSHRLTTSVRRAAGAAPATGWTVRYEITAGEPAGFAPDGRTVIDVPVDAQGNASVDIRQTGSAPGATTVSIQILRPGFVGGGAPMVVGQGWTSVTWSAPGLSVSVAGPQSVQKGLEANYRITVVNPGDIPVRDVTVSTELPPTLDFLGSNPPGQELGQRFDWRIGDLAPQTPRTIDVKVLAVAGGPIRFRAVASSPDGIQSEGEAASVVSQQSLTLGLTGPQTASVGERVTFRIELANIGDQVLRGVKLRAIFPRELEEHTGLPGPLEWEFGDLQPRERAEPRGITFFVRQPGERICLTMEAGAQGAELTTAQACLAAAVKNVSSLNVVKAGPAEVAVGGTAEYSIEVTNTGNTPLNNLKIADQYAASMTPTAGTQGFAFEAGAIVWTIPDLPPNTTVRRRVACQAIRADASAVNRVVVTADGVTGEHAVTTRIVDGAPMRVPVPALGKEKGAEASESGNVNADGRLELSVRESAESATVNQPVTYFIQASNARDVSDREVRLRVTLPEGLSYVSSKGRYAATPVGPDNRVIDIMPIVEMRPRETVDVVELKVRGKIAGKQTIQIEASSQRAPSGVSISEETTIYP